jgi:uncharacterized protein (TIGR00251 family)
MTNKRNYDLHDGKFGSAITVHITPKASKNEITEILNDGTIKIHLMTATVEDQANQVLVQFLAAALKITPASIEIVAGQSGKDKLVSILGLDSSVVHQRIIKYLE